MKHLLTITFLSILTLTYAQVPSYVPTNGLVGWWPFNGNANDESGNGTNGTANGATLTADRNGLANSAYSFDGVNDDIEIINHPLFSFLLNSSYSINIWVNLNSLQGTQSLIGQGDGEGQFQNRFWRINTSGIQFVNHIRGNNSDPFDTKNQNSFGTINSWVMITMVRDFGNQLRMNVNGILVDSDIDITGLANPFSTNRNILFGAFLNATTNQKMQFLNGSLDDIGIWNRALTECEIQDLYHAQVGFTTVDAGQDQTICRGTDVTLNGTGGSSLSWNNGVVNGVAFAPNQTSNYVLTGSDSLGCVGTDTVLVTVLDNASSTINQTAIDSYTLNGQTYTQSGTYTQVLTAANGCDSTITLNLELDFTGIQTSTLPSLKLYPNPVQDVLHIEGLAGKEFEFEVLSIDGKLLQKGKSQGEISVKELRKGNYVLRVGQQQVSFVKQ